MSDASTRIGADYELGGSRPELCDCDGAIAPGWTDRKLENVNDVSPVTGGRAW